MNSQYFRDDFDDSWDAASDRDLDAPCRKIRRRNARRQFPWERGRVAWDVSQRAEEILNRLEFHPRNFFSLRQTATIFGVSTQPVRDWVRRRHLKRDGPRNQFRKAELCRFMKWLSKRAEPFTSEDYLDRIYRKTGFQSPFRKLSRSRFVWPKGEDALRPRQLAKLIGCHPTLVLLAIRRGEIKVKRPTPCRSLITRRAWMRSFPLSQCRQR